MHPPWLVLVAFGAAVTSPGCGKKEPQTTPPEKAPPPSTPTTPPTPPTPDPPASVVQKLRDFADALCACKDRPCGDKVVEEITRWGEQVGPDVGPLPAAVLSPIADKLRPCISRLGLVTPTPTPVTPAKQTPPYTAANVIHAARTWMATSHPDLTLVKLNVSYVDEQGVLDPEHGTIEFTLAPYRAEDDPTRRLGAPSRPSTRQKAGCPTMRFTASGTWLPATTVVCDEVVPLSPRCEITEVWRRAIKDGATPQAVAVIHFVRGPTRATWHFRISDPSRGVDYLAVIEDDCEVTIELPPPPPPAEHTPFPF